MAARPQPTYASSATATPAALGIPVLLGRDISEGDRTSSQPVVMINNTMAKALWPGEDAIGKVVLNACGAERTVVGVVGDVRHLALEQGSGNEMYLPMRQCRDQASADLVIRSTLAPEPLAGAVREALKPLAPNLTNDFRTLQQLVDKSVSPRRFLVLLLAGFASFALVLASLGIYGLISYSVNQRTQEIGIRMAIGASAREVQAGIIAQTLWLVAIGVTIGAVASSALARGLRGLLFEVTATDPWTFVGMLVVLTTVAALAGYLPARRPASSRYSVSNCAAVQSASWARAQACADAAIRVARSGSAWTLRMASASARGVAALVASAIAGAQSAR